jgi:hypothetical protein
MRGRNRHLNHLIRHADDLALAYRTVQSIKPYVRVEQQLSRWDEGAQNDFLLEALNAVRKRLVNPRRQWTTS